MDHDFQRLNDIQSIEDIDENVNLIDFKKVVVEWSFDANSHASVYESHYEYIDACI